MKRLMTFAMVVASLAAALAVHAENPPAGQVDFGTFTPPASGGEFVEVNISSSLISMAARLVEKQEPDIAQLLNGLHLVQVHVVGLDDSNRTDLEHRIQKLRKELDTKGWEKVVTARKEDHDVGIYLKTQNKDTVQGLVVMVVESDKQAVFINIVGDIQPEKLAVLGERLHIDPLKEIGKVTEK